MIEAIHLLPVGFGLLASGFFCGWLVASNRAETRTRQAVVDRCLSVDGNLYALFPMNVTINQPQDTEKRA